MATKPQRSSNRARPMRTVVIFLAVIVALYALVALIGATGSKKDDSPWHPKLGLDLEGGTRITFEAKAEPGKKVDAPKLEQARNIIDQRVNASGVAEAEVTTQGGDQIIVEIPGEKRANIVDEVGKTAQLRFRLVWAGNLPSATTPADVSAQKAVVDKVDWSKVSLDQMITAETQGLQTLPADVQPAIKALQEEAAGFVCDPKGVDVDDVANKPLVTCDTSTGDVQILSPTVVPGSDIAKAEPQYDSQRAQWTIAVKLKGDSKGAFKAVTTELSKAQNQFAIVLDGETISTLASQAAITNGESSIQGGFTATTAKQLSNQLKFGALPLTFSVNGSEEIGPSLAGTQLNAGLAAGAIGLLLVVVYCLLYYRGLGLVIIGSLLVASALTYVMVLLLGQGVGFTLTLPGIAGLIVAIGITADSFIVFFERIRDEVRDGKSLRLAVEAGWVRARSTILAADAVSIIAAVTLFIFAIGVVRGFAFALGLTTLIDVFVVFFFTKPLVSLLARTKFFGQGHKLSGLDASHLGITGRKVSEIARAAKPSTPGKAI
ncbi:protein translocase subunit SecD [Aeromicrobium endophyticum]|uniref:Protein translocase subunit SecD n=1 Tax=Aeromicrobium endophyticum TaxID=2292704 RepID=A0A371P225_9ACTN|nr:protein translocase subunit SecD [Aeromicrobium endophyticum]REK69993.1 protein translocase subunit SecD [Aeromicrobium endophyticum]